MRLANEVPRHKKMTLDQIMSFSFSTLFKERSAYGQWLLLSMIVVVVNLIPVGIFIMGIDFSGTIPIYATSEEVFKNLNMGSMMAASLLFMVALLLDLVFAFFSSAWLLRLGLDAYDGVKRNFKERLGQSFKDLGKIIGPALLLGIFNFIVLLPYIVLSAMSDASQDTALLGASMLCYFLGVLVMVFVSVKLSCLFGLILDRDMPFMEALKLSFAMTKGRGWRIFGYKFLINILSGLLVFAIFIPAMILWAVTIVANFDASLLGASVVLSIIVYMVALCIQYGVSCNLPMAVYRCLEKEHSEDPEPEQQDQMPKPPTDDILF